MATAHLTNGDDRLEIAYLDENSDAAETVLLIHGFASTRQVNWVNTGWVKALTGAGYRVVAFDNRGHGESTKFHDPADYPLSKLAGDAIALLDHLGVERVHLAGYSMGARIAATLAVGHAGRLGKVVLSGYGSAMTRGRQHWEGVRDALLAPSLDDVDGVKEREFRIFADQTGSDRLALAACIEGARESVSADALREVQNDVLVAVGTEDDIAGSGEDLAALFPHGRFLPIPGRDHMKAVGDRGHIRGVLEFLSSQ
ncbi:MAG: alpha/beta fold hydrolase [Nitratireductor sp.]|nr:alpha/beta fold hydrolase [Nitratireductor sp.]